MTRFSKLVIKPDGSVGETDVREIQQADIGKCPFFIFQADHYRQDGTCRCDDPEHTEMSEWGYTWKDGRWQG